jgi:epsilon-lactone hydrolase
MTLVHHPIVPQDRIAMVQLREMAAPAKGVLDRAAFDAVIEHTPRAIDVTYEAAVVGGVTGWWCRPLHQTPGAAILYLHGGAYILGTAKAYRNFVGQIAQRAQRAAFIPDYALAPERPFPAAVTDAEAAYAGLLGQGFADLSLVGDSAGGGLALVLASVLATGRSQTLPTRVAVMSPWTDLVLTGATMDSRADADPFLTKAALGSAAHQYLGRHDPRDPKASPLYGNPRGLPPIRVDVGEDEILLDDARRYAAEVASAEGEVEVHTWEGMPHVFPANVGILQASDAALDYIASFLHRRQVAPHPSRDMKRSPDRAASTVQESSRPPPNFGVL